MSSVTLQRQQSKFQFPFKAVGLLLIAIALFGFIYSFYPARQTVAEIDLGSKLVGVALRGHPSGDYARAATEGRPYEGPSESLVVINASFGQRPSPTPVTCEIAGVPQSITEGRTKLNLSYMCFGQSVDAARLKVDWTISAGRVESSNPATLAIDTTGLAGQRVILAAAVSGCGRGTCLKRFVIPVAQPTSRIVVRVTDETGKGVPRAVVTLDQVTRTRTDARGNAQFADLKPGKYTISVEADGFDKYNTTRELTSGGLLLPVPLVRTQTASPSPTVTPSPSPSPSAETSPSPSPTASASPSASASAELTPSPSPLPTPTESETVFAPGQNGSLTLSWPRTVSSGWSNVCRIRYVPPPGFQIANVNAAFFLTSATGLAQKTIGSEFQPVDQNAHEWNIPMEPVGPDGSLVTAQVLMSVRIGSESDWRNVPLQPLQSTIDEKPLTKNQTVGGSALSGLLGAGLFGVGRIKKKTIEEIEPDESDLDGELEEGESEPLPESPMGAEPVPEAVAAGAQRTTPAESPRYTDITIYEDHLFPTDDLDDATKVPDDVPLVMNNAYTLEVAIRLKRTGILSDLPAKREVDNPREEQETLTIHVLATPIRGFKITERLATISWSFNSDSDSALFQLDIDPNTDTSRPGSIEIRILDESLNLLDILMLEVAIVADESGD